MVAMVIYDYAAWISSAVLTRSTCPLSLLRARNQTVRFPPKADIQTETPPGRRRVSPVGHVCSFARDQHGFVVRVEDLAGEVRACLHRGAELLEGEPSAGVSRH